MGLIIVGIALFVYGTMTQISYGNSSEFRCTKTVHATVVRNLERITESGKTKYSPVFEYEYDGERYTYISDASAKSPEYSEFEQVTIRIDPNDPEKVYCAPKGASKMLTLMFKIGGGSFVLGGLGMLIMVKSKPPKPNI